MKCSRRRVAFFILLAIATSTLWAGRAPILRGIAKRWIVSDEPRPADAIVILGGGIDTRPQIAARLYHQGFAPRILIMQPKPAYLKKYRVVVDDIPKTRKLLEEARVPPEAIWMVEPKVNNTYDEAVVLAEWARANDAHLFLVPTDMFHTRRVRWVFMRQLRPVNASALVFAVPRQKYTADNWWQTEFGLREFRLEIVKLCVYLLCY